MKKTIELPDQLVLILEDDAIVASDLATVFETHGWATRHVTSVADALAVLQNEPVTLVVTDLFLFDPAQAYESGNKLIHRMRNNRMFETLPKFVETLPIIAMSGAAERPEHAYVLIPAKALGADVVMKKPIDGRALIGKATHLLEQRLTAA